MARPAQSASIPSDLPSKAVRSLKHQPDLETAEESAPRRLERRLRVLPRGTAVTARALGASNRAAAKPVGPSDTPTVTYSAEFAALLQAARPMARLDWLSSQVRQRRPRRVFGSASGYLQVIAVCVLALVAGFGTAYLPLGGSKPLAEIAYQEAAGVSGSPDVVTPAVEKSSHDVDPPAIGAGVLTALASRLDPVAALFTVSAYEAPAAPTPTPTPSIPTITATAVPAALPLLEPTVHRPASILPPLGMDVDTIRPISVVSNETQPPTPPQGESRATYVQARPGTIRSADEPEQETPDESTASGDSADDAASSRSEGPDVSTSGSTNRSASAASARADKNVDPGKVSGESSGAAGGDTKDAEKDKKDKEKDKDKDKGKGGGDKGKGDKGKDGKH